MPSVSVIIPNYNHARFLRKRLDSILSQTYNDFELIILDDASTDNSRDIIREYAIINHPIRTIFNQTNSGSPFLQWNKGVEISQGEYIWIAETDDYCEDTFLERLVGIMSNNLNVGIAYCQSWQINEEDQILQSLDTWTTDLDPDRWRQAYINNGREECTKYLFYKNTIPNASAVLIRKEAYTFAQPHINSFLLAGDYMLWARISSRYDIAYIPDKLNYFRTHPCTTRNKTPRLKTVLENLDIFKYITTNHTLTPASYESGLKRLIRLWATAALSRTNKLTLAENITIYNKLRPLNNHVLYYFILEALSYITTKPRTIIRNSINAIFIHKRQSPPGD